MNTISLGPIKGVSDELIATLNDRLRRLASGPETTNIVTTRSLRKRNFPASRYSEGAFLTEMDRGPSLYQVQNGNWVLISGSLAGLYAARPTDVAGSDAGFLYFSTDTAAIFRWSGSDWDNITPSSDHQIAYSSGNLTLGSGPFFIADVPGAAITLNRAGRYLITGVFDFQTIGLDVGFALQGALNINGPDLTTNMAVLIGATNGDSGTVSQSWTYTAAAAGEIVKLRAYKGGGTGTSIVQAPHSSISALWIAAT